MQKRMWVTTVLLSLSLILPGGKTFAIGEIFKIEAVGTEYCGDFDFHKFTASNNLDLWMRIDSETELTVSLTSDFSSGTTFSMIGLSYLTGKTTAAFVAKAIFNDGSWGAIQGTGKFDRSGMVKSLSGTFIQSEVYLPGCFSSGPFKSVQRLQ